MTTGKEKLINFNISQRWRKARISFFEEQIKTIGRLTSVLSDMPKGSRKVQDIEAESLSTLLDKIRDLKKDIEQESIKAEEELKEQLSLLEPKYGLLLYHHYILGDSIKYIAKEVLHNEIKYTYRLRDKALEEFDRLGVKK